MYGLYGLKHHTVEMSPCGTDGRTNERRTREDKATQPLDAGRLSFAKMSYCLIGRHYNFMGKQVISCIFFCFVTPSTQFLFFEFQGTLTANKYCLNHLNYHVSHTPHICHNHHNRWLCKKFQSSVKFSKVERKETNLISHKMCSFTKIV